MRVKIDSVRYRTVRRASLGPFPGLWSRDPGVAPRQPLTASAPELLKEKGHVASKVWFQPEAPGPAREQAPQTLKDVWEAYLNSSYDFGGVSLFHLNQNFCVKMETHRTLQMRVTGRKAEPVRRADEVTGQAQGPARAPPERKGRVCTAEKCR